MTSGSVALDTRRFFGVNGVMMFLPGLTFVDGEGGSDFTLTPEPVPFSEGRSRHHTLGSFAGR